MTDETTRLRALLERDAALIVAVADITALLDRMERAERERDAAVATLETRNAKHAAAVARVAELEAIIAGRTTPPTDAERAAHRGFFRYEWSEAAERWWACDAEGRPCAWPTAEVSRG